MDPYKVLGVSPDATDEEVKQAYKELVKKYHPDKYAANPLSDLAEEKMQEVNAAYDQIMNMRRGGTGTTGRGSSSRRNYTDTQNPQYMNVRNFIRAGKLVEAEEILDGIPVASRDAEWNFLKGSVFYSRGWLDEAYNSFSIAVKMNPNNPEYRAALNQMAWQRQGNMNGAPGGYRTTPTGGGCSACDLCSGLICADCCCECFGGDFISCC